MPPSQNRSKGKRAAISKDKEKSYTDQDVLEALRTDLHVRGANAGNPAQRGGERPSQSGRNNKELPVDRGAATSTHTGRQEPYLIIKDQPAQRVRFRSLAELESTGSIHGLHTNYPKVQILYLIGTAVIYGYLVTNDNSNKVHHYELIENANVVEVFYKEVEVTEDNNTFDLMRLGIHAKSPKIIADDTSALNQPGTNKVDLVGNGFVKLPLTKEDKRSVRLCLQLLVPDDTGRRLRKVGQPVISSAIFNNKDNALELVIRNHGKRKRSATAKGGVPLDILHNKISYSDIQVVFYDNDGWEVEAKDAKSHYNCAVSCTVPPYKDPHITDDVSVYVQLKINKGNIKSDPIGFVYTPDDDDKCLRKKLKKTLTDEFNDFVKRDWLNANPLQIIDSAQQGHAPQIGQDQLFVQDMPGPSHGGLAMSVANSSASTSTSQNYKMALTIPIAEPGPIHGRSLEKIDMLAKYHINGDYRGNPSFNTQTQAWPCTPYTEGGYATPTAGHINVGAPSTNPFLNDDTCAIQLQGTTPGQMQTPSTPTTSATDSYGNYANYTNQYQVTESAAMQTPSTPTTSATDSYGNYANYTNQYQVTESAQMQTLSMSDIINGLFEIS